MLVPAQASVSRAQNRHTVDRKSIDGIETMASLIASAKLPVFVDCLEFCPFDTHSDLLACGLYQLQDGTKQTRFGGVQILRIDNSNVSIFENFANYHIDTAGTLTLRWLTPDKLICACSDSQLRILQLNHSNGEIDCVDIVLILADNNLLLSVEIDETRQSFLIGHSTGQISFGKIDNPGKFVSWSGHGQSEVWCVEFHRGDPNQLLSGADDGLMKVWDRRMIDSSGSSDQNINIDQNSVNAVSTFRHDAGVTAILSTQNSHKIWTGSYDDQLRLWDVRNRKTPLNSLNLGGGVWRIRPNGNYLLCACMYNGWSIIDCGIDALTGADIGDQMVIRLADDSCGAALLYGIDWVPGMNRIACSTFYDYTVRLYDITMVMKM